MNVTDGKLYTKTSGGVVKEVGGKNDVKLYKQLQIMV